MGLRLRLILIVVLPALLVLGAHGFVRVRQEEAQLLAEDQQKVALAARAVQIAVENALRDRQITDVKRLLSEMAVREQEIERIRLFDRTLAPTLSSDPESRSAPAPAAMLRRVLAGAPAAERARRRAAEDHGGPRGGRAPSTAS
jgi:hypothetical protein